MGLSKTLDQTRNYKGGNYNLIVDVSGWDNTTFQFVAPVNGTINITGSSDMGSPQVASGYYNPNLAQNFTAIQAINLSTGGAVTSVTAAGQYSISNKMQFIRLSGGGDVYKLIQTNTKIG